MNDQQLMRSAVPMTQLCPGAAHRALHLDPSKEPVWGEPVWCAACIDDIARAIGALPDLAAGLWDIGHWTVETERRVVGRVVAVVLDQQGRDRVLMRERLDCGHNMPAVIRPRKDDLPLPAETRKCWQCAINEPGADGRLAPVPAAARRGPRLNGSPAGSSSYLAVDEVVTWTNATVDYLKARLPQQGIPAPDLRRATDEQRARALSTACAFLVEWRFHLLATPHAKAIGREALDLARRARRGAGIDTPAPTPIPGVPCPSCGLVALKRAGHNPDLVICSSCGAMTHDNSLS